MGNFENTLKTTETCGIFWTPLKHIISKKNKKKTLKPVDNFENTFIKHTIWKPLMADLKQTIWKPVKPIRDFENTLKHNEINWYPIELWSLRGNHWNLRFLTGTQMKHCGCAGMHGEKICFCDTVESKDFITTVWSNHKHTGYINLSRVAVMSENNFDSLLACHLHASSMFPCWPETSWSWIEPIQVWIESVNWLLISYPYFVYSMIFLLPTNFRHIVALRWGIFKANNICNLSQACNGSSSLAYPQYNFEYWISNSLPKFMELGTAWVQ